MGSADDHRGEDQGDEWTRDSGTESGPEDDDRQGQTGNAHRGRIGRPELPHIFRPLTDERRWNRRHAQPQQILDLGGKNDESDPAREPRHDRERNELDSPAESGEPESDEHDPTHESSNRQAVESIALDDAIDDHDKGPG